MKRLWFKAKDYGLGWCPCSLEGWVVLFSYILAVILLVIFVKNIILLVTFIIILFIVFITLSYKKGEKLGWRWHKNK